MLRFEDKTFVRSVLDQVRISIAWGTTDNDALNMNIKSGKEHKRFSGGPGEPERVPEGAEQRASHCCRQKR